jgi:hypothetical protein
MSVFDRERFDHEIAAMRAALKDEKFNAEYAAGKTMTEEQAIAYAMEDTDKA